MTRLKREINDLLSKEEKMWKQRSRELWLHEGDKNTRYFHSRATHRYRRNKIEELENHLGERCVDENGIANILVDFYQNLFTSSSPNRIEEALEATPRVVTEEMNHELVAPFGRDEVVIALNQMDPLKSPGPDGMPPLFFQQFWSVIGDEVADAVLTCLNTGSIPPSINRTFITLIPKVKSPVRVSEYRPIALCNIYGDNWLPGKGSARIVSPQVVALKGAQVAALINPNTRTWNINLLNQNFLSFEVTRIKAIPLSWTEQEDRLIWPDSHDGEYSVKAGYQTFCREANSSAASSSDSSHRSAFWKRLWKLHVPNKIKFFLWRVCSNALPTKDNLKRRKILEDARCSACLLDQETTFHALWSCETLKDIWNPCFSWVRTECPHLQDMQELINLVGQRAKGLELFGVVA